MKHSTPRGPVLLATFAIAISMTIGCGDDDGGSSSEGPIPIGFLAPLSGPAAAVGEDTQQGVQLALQRLNDDGGIDGRTLDLRVEDSQFDPNVGSDATTRFARDADMPLMIGSVETAVLNAQRPIADRLQFPVIATVGDGPGENGSDSYVLNPYPSCQGPLARLAQRVASEVGGSFAGIGWDDVAATSCLDGFEAGLPDGFAATQLVPLSATDMTGPLARLRQSDAAGLAVMAAGPTPVLITEQVRAIDWNVRMFGWGGYQGTTDFADPAGPAANGFTLVGTFAPDLRDAKVTQEFVAAFTERFGEAPNEFNAAGYDAALLAIAAIKEAGTDRERINSFLHDVQDFPASAADITMEPDGGVRRDVYLQKWENGSLVGEETIDDGSLMPPDLAGN
jgi:branched-chain amino acid transport system substrate-binding protein